MIHAGYTLGVTLISGRLSLEKDDSHTEIPHSSRCLEQKSSNADFQVRRILEGTSQPQQYCGTSRTWISIKQGCEGGVELGGPKRP